MSILNLSCNGWSVEDHGVVAADAKQKEYCGKSGKWDPERSLLDCLAKENLLVGKAVSLLHTLLDLLQLHLHTRVSGQNDIGQKNMFMKTEYYSCD